MKRNMLVFEVKVNMTGALEDASFEDYTQSELVQEVRGALEDTALDVCENPRGTSVRRVKR